MQLSNKDVGKTIQVCLGWDDYGVASYISGILLAVNSFTNKCVVAAKEPNKDKIVIYPTEWDWEIVGEQTGPKKVEVTAKMIDEISRCFINIKGTGTLRDYHNFLVEALGLND